MSQKKPRINSAEVANLMLKLGRPVSAPELATILSQAYPGLLVENHDVYIRLKGFYESDKAVCFMNDQVRPRTFHLKSISCNYFKFRNGRKTNLEGTKIAHGKTGWDMSRSEKDKKHQETRRMCQRIFHDLEIARRNRLQAVPPTVKVRVDISLFKQNPSRTTAYPATTRSLTQKSPVSVHTVFTGCFEHSASKIRFKNDGAVMWWVSDLAEKGEYRFSTKPPT